MIDITSWSILLLPVVCLIPLILVLIFGGERTYSIVATEKDIERLKQTERRRKR